MTITIDIDDRVASSLASQAQAWGLSLEEFLRRIAENLQSPTISPADATAEFDAALDELFSTESGNQPSTDLTYSRDDIYLEHD